MTLANGDEIGVVTPWQWPDPFDDITVEDLKAVQNAIGDRQLRENSQAKDWAGYTIAEVLGMDAEDKADRAKIKACLKTWTENGALKCVYLEDEKGQRRPFLEVGEWAE